MPLNSTLRLTAFALFTLLAIGSTATATSPKSHSAPEPKRVSVAPGCCSDATISITICNARPCFTEGGVRAFMTLFQAAAEKGVENATIRAFNATKATPACKDCDKEKK